MLYFQPGRRLLMALTLILGFLSSAIAQEGSHTLTIFVDKSYPPYMYESEGMKAEGIYPRILGAAVVRAGYQPDIKAYPWKRALLYSEEGKGAVGGAYLNDERLKIYDYSAPLYREKLVVFVNKNKPFDFQTIDDLSGKLVGVNRGWSYGTAFDEARDKERFRVNIRNNPEDNFKMLALGRIDCLILDQMSGESYIRLLEIGEQVEALAKPFSINNGYLIIPKTLEMREFLDKFNTSLSKMREDGTYERIVQSFVKGTLAQ